MMSRLFATPRSKKPAADVQANPERADALRHRSVVLMQFGWTGTFYAAVLLRQCLMSRRLPRRRDVDERP